MLSISDTEHIQRLIQLLPGAGPTDEWNDPTTQKSAFYHQSTPLMKRLQSGLTVSSAAPTHSHITAISHYVYQVPYIAGKTSQITNLTGINSA